jgi:DNA primase
VIPDEVVERVREEADAVAIIGEFVKLKRVGSSFRGPCPFHHGKNDNFSLTPRGGYKCFVCGESGDVFTFVEKHLGLDFVEAVKWVGARSGVEVREVARRSEERDAREPLWDVNGNAAAFFSGQLWESDAGAAARAYLAGRGIDREQAERFSLGYAPRDGAVMHKALGSLGFDDGRQLAAGVLVVREGNPQPVARFRDRLMFPIFDPAGHIAGFGGRVLGDGTPKYLNSAESEVFSKRNFLYGLNWAKQAIRKADRLIVVEGYFDAIRLMLAGVDEVVAPLGTALTESQAALIGKYTRNVFLLYDSDQAGLKATFRAGDVLLASGLNARVVSLPDGEDPDTFVARHGAAGFEHAAAASVDVFDRRIQILERGGWFGDLRRKREALDKLLPTIRLTADPLLRDLYLSRTCEVAGVSREMVARELERPDRAMRSRGSRQTEPAGARGGSTNRAGGDVDFGASDANGGERRGRSGDRRRAGPRSPTALVERELLRTLLHVRALVEPVAERIDAAAFRVPEYRQIFEGLATRGSDVGVEELAAGLDESSGAALQELLELTGGLERADEVVEASVNRFLAEGIREEQLSLDERFSAAQEEEQDALFARKKALTQQLADLKQHPWKVY